MIRRSGYLVAMIWSPAWRRWTLCPSTVNCCSFWRAVMLRPELRTPQTHLTMRLWASGRRLAICLSDAFKNQAQGFAAIAGEVTELALEIKISEALDKAIILSEKDVLALIRLRRNDMSALHERRRSILSAARVSATDAYNEQLETTSPNPDKLQKAASEIKAVEDAWDSLPLLLGAGPALDAMAQAHHKLVDYAKSSKNPQDLSELIEATDAFVTRATVIADAVKTIREAKE